MKVLSLFDGCWMAYQALKNIGIKVEYYRASEIDESAIEIAHKNHPDIQEWWCVQGMLRAKRWNERAYFPAPWNVIMTDIDLLIWWSPCQDLSIAGKRKWLTWSRSGLFWEYVRMLQAVQPKYFILENVASMPKAAKQLITDTLWVEPIMINAALVTAQNRKRLFWTNIPWVTQPEDKHIHITSIIDWGNTTIKKSPDFMKGKVVDGVLRLPEANKKWYVEIHEWEIFDAHYMWSKTRRGRKMENKCNALTGDVQYYIFMNGDARKLTPLECERLQWLPDGYTEWVSDTRRLKMIVNGFAVPVISHIISFIKDL